MGYLIQYSAPRNTVWTAFATRRDHSSMCGRYITPTEAAMERPTACRRVSGRRGHAVFIEGRP